MATSNASDHSQTPASPLAGAALVLVFGFGWAAVMLVTAKTLGASHADLVAYGTSGDVTGDNRQVVGYAAVAVW